MANTLSTTATHTCDLLRQGTTEASGIGAAAATSPAGRPRRFGAPGQLTS
ncbi:hypothetical protein [Rhodococcus qingshengii]|nr:hypothetical protein [Rhodococcus qingshengii]MDJ0490932.1 hypothetical protein [Rhodococcus qingshengii]